MARPKKTDAPDQNTPTEAPSTPVAQTSAQARVSVINRRLQNGAFGAEPGLGKSPDPVLKEVIGQEGIIDDRAVVG